jgi:plastocyanin
MVSQPMVSASDIGKTPWRPSRKLLLAGAGLVIVFGLVVGGFVAMHGSKNQDDGAVVALSSKVADVTIDASGYVPSTVQVKAGQQVTWTNQMTTPVQLTADASSLPGFTTVEPLDQGDSYTYIFDKAGTYRYYDATDPAKFVGTITVK